MKKTVLIIVAVIGFAFAANAQKNFVYCELLGKGKAFSSKLKVRANFGQQISFWKGVDYIRDAKGRKMSFNSMVDAMNFLGTQGWEFVQATVVVEDGESTFSWLLKKEITKEESKRLEESFTPDK
ncbi:MAG: hypothetical protein LBU90_09810 [Bacteroidales bacterium]|jgi:hypothetical protein|nr:hypothetical protein [Bacteroidales bacterium]